MTQFQQLTLFNLEEYTVETENLTSVIQQQVKQIPAKPKATQMELELYPCPIVQVVYYHPKKLSA
jgi:hypothetical protein